MSDEKKPKLPVTGSYVPVRKMPDKSLCMTMEWANGSFGKHKFSARPIVGGGFIIDFGALNRRYVVDLHDMVEAAFRSFEREEKRAKKEKKP